MPVAGLAWAHAGPTHCRPRRDEAPAGLHFGSSRPANGLRVSMFSVLKHSAQDNVTLPLSSQILITVSSLSDGWLRGSG